MSDEENTRPLRGRTRIDTRIGNSQRGYGGAALRRRLCTTVCVGLLCLVALPSAALPGRVGASTAPTLFPGPSTGLGTMTHPTGTTLVYTCNSQSSEQLYHVAGAPVITGTAIEAVGTCGEATLMLNHPSSGRLTARFAVADEDATGKAATVRISVIRRDGYPISFEDVTTSRALGARAIDVGVADAVAIVFDFTTAPMTLVYNMSLSGTARALTPAPGTGSQLPAGATPITMATAHYSCNAAAAATDPLTVTQVGLTPGTTATGTGCGQITIGLHPETGGTLVLRYGALDTSTAGDREKLSVRVLDATGTLLHKAIGIAFVGGGLRPLWVDLRGGSTIVMTVDGGTAVRLAVTAVSIMPGQLPAYTYPDRILSSPSGKTYSVDADAFVSQCNAVVGTTDTTVLHLPIFAGTYIAAAGGCGTTGLILGPNAHGTFTAFLGVPDDAPSGAPPTVKIVVQDRTNHPLLVRTYRASYGAAGTPISIDITHASTLSFAFTGPSAVLYNVQITGRATVIDQVYPSTTPPVIFAGGNAVHPSAFHLDCNANITKDDRLLVHESTLETWALSGTECGSASLKLSGLHVPHAVFATRMGIEAGDPPTTIVKIELNVLDSHGASIRHSTWSLRYGYGPIDASITLKGGATVQILWLTGNTDSAVDLYGMTLK